PTNPVQPEFGPFVDVVVIGRSHGATGQPDRRRVEVRHRVSRGEQLPSLRDVGDVTSRQRLAHDRPYPQRTEPLHPFRTPQSASFWVACTALTLLNRGVSDAASGPVVA